jgi:hypothetical protein
LAAAHSSKAQRRDDKESCLHDFWGLDEFLFLTKISKLSALT